MVKLLSSNFCFSVVAGTDDPVLKVHALEPTGMKIRSVGCYLFTLSADERSSGSRRQGSQRLQLIPSLGSIPRRPSPWIYLCCHCSFLS